MKLFLVLLSFTQISLAASQEYRLLNRTYINLGALDLSECMANYRFINGNWMDCSMSLPNPITIKDLGQVIPAHYKSQSFTFSIPDSEYQLYINIRTFAHDYIEASLGTKLLISSYYIKKVRTGIETLSANFYGHERLRNYLRLALTKISQQRDWKTQSPIIAIPASKNNGMVEDHILGAIYVVRREIKLEAEECKAKFNSWLVDAWPDPDYWMSGCSMSYQKVTPVPLKSDFWGEALQSAKHTSFSLGDAINTVLSYGPSGYATYQWGKLNWEDSQNSIKAVFEKAGNNLYGYFILDESKLDTLGESDEILGKLIHQNGKLTISPR